MSIELTSIVACDQIRFERNGGAILISTMSGELIVPAYPAVLQMALWLEFLVPETKKYHIDIRIEPPSGNPAVMVGFDVNVNKPGGMNVPLPKFGMQLERDGEIVFSWRVDGGEWKVVKRLAIYRQSTAPQPAAPQSA